MLDVEGEDPVVVWLGTLVVQLGLDLVPGGGLHLGQAPRQLHAAQHAARHHLQWGNFVDNYLFKVRTLSSLSKF